MMRHFGMPMDQMFRGGYGFGQTKMLNPAQSPVQAEPQALTSPGTMGPEQDQVRSPFNRGPVMGGGFFGGGPSMGAGGGWRGGSPFGGGFMGGGFGQPRFGSPFGGGFMGGSPFGGGFMQGGSPFGGSQQMMNGYMGNLMQPFNFGFQPSQQAQPQPQQPQLPPPNIPPMYQDYGGGATGGGN
jgi:hypothetical protein